MLLEKICYIIRFEFGRFLPESTRWLITMRRYDEAKQLILRAARVNNKHVPDSLLVVPDESADNPEVNSCNRIIFPTLNKDTAYLMCIERQWQRF